MNPDTDALDNLALNDAPARWRVALLGARGDALSDLRRAITEAGGDVVVEAPPRSDSVPRLAHAAPNVLILHPRSGSRPADLAAFTSGGHPVVLFTRDTSRATLDVAARAGVTALLFQPLQPAQLPPTLDLAIARHADCERLKKKLADRKIIERAKGRIMALANLTEDAAFRWLRSRSMDLRATLVDVANSVLAATDAGSTDLECSVDDTTRSPSARDPRTRPRSAARPAASRVHAIGR